MSCCNNECAICFDAIDININCITTECNHRFHSKCFLTNAARNGFDCPMCRTELAEKIEDDDYDSDDDDDDSDDNDDDATTVIQPLSGFRWLFQRAEGEPINDDDEDDFSDSETLLSDDDDYDDFDWKRNDVNAYSITEITEKIIEQNISLRDLVAFFVGPHSNQLADCDEFDKNFMKKMSSMLNPMIGQTI